MRDRSHKAHHERSTVNRVALAVELEELEEPEDQKPKPREGKLLTKGKPSPSRKEDDKE